MYGHATTSLECCIATTVIISERTWHKCTQAKPVRYVMKCS